MMTDALDALRLQIEWGADEALGDAPVDRFAPAARPGPIAPHRPTPARPPIPAAAPVAATLAALNAQIVAFEGCALRATATHTVLPAGNPDSGLILIADAPGSDDDRSGTAFSGSHGAMLDRVLGSAGLDRTGLLLAYLVPWRPPGGRPITDPEIQSCLPFVRRLLALTRPRRLLLLGTAPVRALTGQTEPARRLRGRWLDVTIPGINQPVPALALPPIDQWMRNAAAKQDLWNQVLMLRRVVSSG